MRHSILMLEPDADDRYITQAVFDENHYDLHLDFVSSRDDLFAFLLSCEMARSPCPSLILLNYHSFPDNAVQITRELKKDPRYAHIPVVILTGSVSETITRHCYAAGASSLISKPSAGSEVTRKISTFVNYWFKTVQLA